MKVRPPISAALAFILFIACVIGCKSSSNSTSGDANQSTSSSSNSSTAANPTAESDAPATQANIGGKYNIVGTNPNGAAYRGTVQIIPQGDVYQFRWSAGYQYDGVGVVHGDVVAVAFASGANGKGCGVVDYKIRDDGSLVGRWGYWGTNEAGTENATRISGSDLVGEYDATGKNPNGATYKVKLTVEPAGNIFRFVWSNNTDGVGIRRGDDVAVGVGGSRCGFVVYEIKPDGTLDGIWGGYGSDHTGTETATKR